ncbi:phosphotransferase family protein [Trinickia mobilis]|uniref:phosphotransferase family protein n=1 Tax=Trinickia mobilis TaxID=2816356 RepID=UPI001A8F7F4A|nr:phosphotransferase family protein [Trinickia mobilis]
MLREPSSDPTRDCAIEGLPNPSALERLNQWFTRNDVTRSAVTRASRLSGGAIQENWRLEMSDGRSFVLRTDADAAIPTSCTRAEEYLRYRLAFDHGARVARPYGLCEDLSVIGKPFFILEFVSGVAAGHLLTKGNASVSDREALAFELGELIGVVHRTPADAVLAAMGPRPESAVSASIDHLRGQLDALPDVHPALELCLRDLESKLCAATEGVFTHGDFRTGNYMVDNGRVCAILDWEFSGWGHPLEDLGWFTAPCWRFGRPDLSAGGIGSLRSFLEGYRQATGREIQPDELGEWQALAQVKWAVIALHQEERHASGAQRSLELALSGRLVAGLTLEAMNLLEIR